MKMTVSFPSGKPVPQLSAPGLEPRFAAGEDFWRIHLDTDEIRELTVFSADQAPPQVSYSNDETIYTYPKLKAENGETYDVTYHLSIREENGELIFRSTVENRCNIRVNEIQAPFLAFDRLNSAPEDEVLYIPNSLGERIENPRKWVRDTCHTEYMAADYRNIWYSAVYPSPMAMAWMGVQSGGKFLCLFRKDEKFRICAFCVGNSPRNTPSQLVLTVSQYPMAVQGETIETAPVTLAVYDDWRGASRDYRAWAESWYHPAPRPQWVQNMTGWQRIIMKHQYGEIFFRYEDLPKLYLDGKKAGLDTLLVFGWWKGRFDNNYPHYEADETLGGAEGLKAAIAEVQRLGGRVLLYSNGKLIDVKTEFYREHGHDCCQIDIDGNEYREHYQFSNNGTVLRRFGYKTFVTGCMATPEWHDRLLDTTRVKLAFHPDSVFYDQIGGCTRLCFNKNHEHGGRADEEALYRLRNLDDIRAMLEPEQAIGSENLTDVFSSRLDYLHGCCNGCWTGPNYYPDLYLATFPDVIITNRMMHDEREDFRRHYNSAFIYGLRFDASVYRCRKVSIAAMPNMTAHLRKLTDLKEKYRRFFYEGTFISEQDFSLPEGVRCTQYRHGDECMTAFLNNNPEPVTFDFQGHTVTIGGEDVACLVL